jgi:hypothetical protein
MLIYSFLSIHFPWLTKTKFFGEARLVLQLQYKPLQAFSSPLLGPAFPVVAIAKSDFSGFTGTPKYHFFCDSRRNNLMVFYCFFLNSA